MYLNPPLHEYNRYIFSQNTITIIHVPECWNKTEYIYTHNVHFHSEGYAGVIKTREIGRKP